jgi:hypothetical protein
MTRLDGEVDRLRAAKVEKRKQKHSWPGPNKFSQNKNTDRDRQARQKTDSMGRDYLSTSLRF